MANYNLETETTTHLKGMSFSDSPSGGFKRTAGYFADIYFHGYPTLADALNYKNIYSDVDGDNRVILYFTSGPVDGFPDVIESKDNKGMIFSFGLFQGGGLDHIYFFCDEIHLVEENEVPESASYLAQFPASVYSCSLNNNKDLED